MSTTNITIINNINTKFNKLIEKYSNNTTVLEGICDYINTGFVTQLDKIHRDIGDIEKIEKEKCYFVNKFLSSTENIFYYIKDTDIFIHYDMEHYKIFEEDELCKQIYNEVTEHQNLSPYKFDIQTEILNELKGQTMFKCLPESFTIQSIIKYLTTYFFNSKEDAKYFCCIVGDIVLKKPTSVKYCINNNLMDFIASFKEIIKTALGINYLEPRDSRFICDTIDQYIDLGYHRVLKSTSENQMFLWNDFLNRHAIDLFAVCIHYSRRYVNAEGYLNHHKDSKTILYLKNNSIKQIVEKFCLNKLEVNTETVSSGISYENMSYLWYRFLRENNIPSLFSKKDNLHQLVKKYVKYNDNNYRYLSIFHKDIRVINDMKHFLSNNINYDVDDELETSELLCIYATTNQPIDEKRMIDIIQYFTDCKFTNYNKTIKNISCKLWDKKGDLKQFINSMKEYLTSDETPIDDISFTNIYTRYCKNTSNTGDVNKIVTKRYFINFIINHIPSEYLMFNNILSKYWYS
tara:strand:- start:964 stop:2517 length:1554 start_codon:yes stop_codon:yes gene_type:complete